MRMAIVAALCVLAAGSAYGLPQEAQMAPQAGVGADLARPDVATWPTVGVTMRMHRDNAALPWQMRQVQVEPGAYQRLIETLALQDGAVLTAQFYDVARDDTHTPPFYAATNDVGLAVEVIDRAHPDGRRFYVFAPGAATARALPAGNECAVCHAARGGFDGTFAQHYPLMARFAAGEAR
jgi:hypothetical protein